MEYVDGATLLGVLQTNPRALLGCIFGHPAFADLFDQPVSSRIALARNRGDPFGLALAASAVLSFIDNFVAPVSQEAGLWQFQVFRTLFAVPLLLVAARMSGEGCW